MTITTETAQITLKLNSAVFGIIDANEEYFIFNFGRRASLFG